MKGSSLYGKINLNRGGQASRPDGRAKSSAFQASVPTKEESKKKALSELNKIHNEQDDAEDRGDVLTENIAHTAGRKKLAEGKKLYGKKKGAPMTVDPKTKPRDIKAKKKKVDPRTDPRHARKLYQAEKKAARKKSPMEKGKTSTLDKLKAAGKAFIAGAKETHGGARAAMDTYAMEKRKYRDAAEKNKKKKGAPMKKSPMEKGKTSKMGKLKALGKAIGTTWRASATENVSDSFWYGKQAYKKSKKESRDADQKNNKK